MIIFPFIILIFFLLMGIPVAFSLILSSIVVLILTDNVAQLVQVPTLLFSSVENFTLLAIPFFILAAEILSKGKVVEYLFDLFSILLKRIPGGLGIVSVVVCILMSAIQGSSAATAAALGKVTVDGMKREGYNKTFAASLIASSGGIAIMVPPSIAMIVYATLSGTSIGKLFFAGVIPGVLTGLLLIGYIIYRVKKDKMEIAIQTEYDKSKLKNLLKKTFPLFFIPVIVFGGFYTGIFTATEVAAICVLYSIFLVLFVYKVFNLKDLYSALNEGSKSTLRIFIIIAGAILFQHVLVLVGFIDSVTSFIISLDLSPWQFMIAVSILLFFLGMFMEGIALNVLTTPIIAPLAIKLGIDPIHYGIVLVLNIEIALISPPVGLHLFILSGVTGIEPERMYKPILPIMLIFVLNLLLLIFFPQISLFIPSLFFKF